MSKPHKIKRVLISLLVVSIILNIVLKNFPLDVERYYSSSLNKWTRQILSNITSIFSFSVAEAIIILVIIAPFAFLFMFFKDRKKLRSFISWSFVLISLTYSLFLFLWGYNYNRPPFIKLVDLKVNNKVVSDSSLYNLCLELSKSANSLREKIKTDKKGIMIISGGYSWVFDNASEGYKNAGKSFKVLEGKYGRPKPVIFSRLMSYTGITGIYFPFTGEANININIPDITLPFTTAHEMAHQRGFAREDEANYIAYITCLMNPHIEFQYSGTMLGLIYSMNALAISNQEMYGRLRKEISRGVLKDLQYLNEFWARYSGNLARISNEVNNLYLRSNGQRKGVKSYGGVVDLLLARHRFK